MAPASISISAAGSPENGGLPDGEDLEALFATILDTIPAPTYDDEAPLQAHVTNLDASNFLGRLTLLRVHNGPITKGQHVAWCKVAGSVERPWALRTRRVSWAAASAHTPSVRNRSYHVRTVCHAPKLIGNDRHGQPVCSR